MLEQCGALHVPGMPKHLSQVTHILGHMFWVLTEMSHETCVAKCHTNCVFTMTSLNKPCSSVPFEPGTNMSHETCVCQCHTRRGSLTYRTTWVFV